MTHQIPTSNRQGVRTFVATLLAYVLLTAQLAPVAVAFNSSANRRTAKTSDIEVKKGERPSKESGASSYAPVPVPLRVTAAGMAPIITATKTDAFPDPDMDGKVSPGQTITYTVTLNNTGPDPALNLTLNDTVDANTTLIPGSAFATPIAFADAYNVIGNVRIQPNAAQGLLANDINPNTGNNTGLTASGGTTSTQGGNVAINADGSFSYDPPVGFTGTDTFTYTATSANGVDTRTVTLTVAGMIFFVNDDDPVAGGDGRLTNPFNCLVGPAGCFSGSTADEAGDNIFLLNGAYTGGLTFLANQKLIGQGATDTLANIAGVGAVQPYSDPLPVTNGTPSNVTITTAIAATNALTVSAGGITLRGFTVGNTTGAKILGSAFGTLTAGNNTSPDLVLNGTGQALNLTTGTFAATSAFLSVATTSSGTQGISLAGVAGTVSFGSTTVSGATTQGILIGTTTANINFGNTSVSGGTDGVSLQNNSSGTRTFGTLSVSGNSGVGFLHAVGGGATTVTGATAITNPTGVGIDVDSSNANLSFAATTVDKSSTGGTGVDLTNNATRTIGFTSLAVTTSNGVSLNTNNSGTVNSGGGSLTATGTGGAASLTNTTLGLTFTSVSSNGGANGFIISGGSGTFTSATTNLQNNAGIGLLMSGSGVAANFGNTTVNSSAGDGVDLSTNTAAITFADLDITPDANLRGLDAANNTGTITSTSGDISTTGAPAINISGPAGRTPLSMTLTNVDSTNSTALGVDLNLVSGNLAVNDPGVATNITNPTGIGIQVRNTASGTINFGNTNVSGSGGTGVALGIGGVNTGNVTFADLDISPDTGQRALFAQSNTGVITSTTGTIATTTAIAVEITGVSAGSRTPLNLQFESISANGSNSIANGLVLTNTSASGSPGGFRVNGTGTTDGSGGTIQNTTTRGANINTVESLLLRNMNFTNANSSVDGGLAGACEDLIITGCNSAIYLNGVTTLATLDNLNLTGTMVENGITAIGVTNFKFDNSVIDGAGNEAHESGIEAQNLSGTSTVNSTEIRFSETNSCDVVNTDVSLNLTISGSTFRDTQTVSSGGATNPNGEGGFQFRSFSSAAGAPTTTINILSSSFLRLRTQGIQVFSNDDTTINLDVTGSTIDSQADIGTGIDINSNNTSTFNFNITANPTIQSRGGAAVNITSFLNSDIEGRVNNNPDIEVLGGAGIPVRLVAQETSQMIVEINGNTVSNVNGTEDTTIDVQSRFQTARVDATITNNTVTAEPTGVAGINLISGSSAAGESNITCGDIANNNVTNAVGNVTRAFRIRISDLSNTNRMFLEGFIEAGTALQDTEATWNGRGNNPTSAAGSEVAASLTGTAVGPLAPPGGVCNAVDIPTDFVTTIIAETNQSSGDANTATIAQQAASANTDSITSRPFISSPRQQLAAPSSTAMAQVVARPKPAPAPGPAPIEPPKGGDGQLATPPMIVGNNLNWDVGTLPAGQSVTITFQVTVNTPPPTFTQVSNQGTVTFGGGGGPVLTDDPDVAGANNPTVTLVTAPPDLFVRDARVAEPTAGSTSMLFTLALSTPAPTGGIVVNLSTANGSATGGTCAGGADYESVTGGTATFAVGEQIKTFQVTVCSDATVEGDETLFLNVNSAPGATIVDGQGLGTITANVAGTTLISELRTSGPGGAGDDFVEIYNNTDTPFTVPAGGYGLFKRGASCDALPVLIGTIPAATVIPQRGHYLFVGSTYSLTAYAGGNAVLTTDIESDFNVGLFSTTDPLSISTANRLDAVGFIGSAGGICDVLREGTALPQALGSTSEYSFVREFTLFSNDVPTPTDDNDNAADFTVISTTPGTPVGSTAAPRLGAPGPENLAGPNWKKFSQVGSQLIDPTLPASVAPNRARDTTPDPANNSTLGTLASRRTFINNTGAPITRLRFRVYDITTFPSPVGTADLRVRTSTNAVVTVTGVGSVTALATTLETPPNQPNSGGLNSSVAAGTVTLGTPLAAGASIHLNFLFGVQQGGSFRVFVFVEAVP